MNAAPHKPTLTVGILTKNEASRIEDCIRSAQSVADQVLVIDSGSSDDTVAIARSLGAEVHNYPDWQGFAVQRNRMLQHCTGDWVFFLDADESMTPEFRHEIATIVARNSAEVWQANWRNVVYGIELKHMRAGQGIPRLFRRDMLIRWEGVVHELPILVGEESGTRVVPRKVLQARLLHYTRASVKASLDKLTQYAMLGAHKRALAGKQGGVVRGLASAFAMFTRMYIFHRGFMDGGAGFLYCSFVAAEAYFRYAALHYDRQTLRGDVGRGA